MRDKVIELRPRSNQPPRLQRALPEAGPVRLVMPAYEEYPEPPLEPMSLRRRFATIFLLSAACWAVVLAPFWLIARVLS